MEIDPVCKMEIEPDHSTGESRYEGETYYFCSTACKDQFDANPAQYASE